MRAQVGRRDVGGDHRRGRAEIRPADGLDRGAVDGPVDVPVAAVVLRENTIVAPIESQNVCGRVLPHVPECQADPGRRSQALGVAAGHHIRRNVGDRLDHGIHGPGHGALCSVHAFVRNAIVPITCVCVFRITMLTDRWKKYVCIYIRCKKNEKKNTFCNSHSWSGYNLFASPVMFVLLD